jgi:uncharacterized membrane protein
MKSSQQPNKSNFKEIYRYASLGMQIFISIAIAVFIGYQADKWLSLRIPLLIWLLPLFMVIMIMYKLIKETSNRKSDDKQN